MNKDHKNHDLSQYVKNLKLRKLEPAAAQLDWVLRWVKRNRHFLSSGDFSHGYNTALKHVESSVNRRLNKLKKECGIT